MSSSPELVEHFFRREYAKLVASLSRRVGVAHMEAVEDAVQSALLTALEQWGRSGAPENPSAWLYRVAHNQVIERLRSGSRRRRILDERSLEVSEYEEPKETALLGEVQDDLLRMLFVCCDEAIPVESQLVLALKILCGFDVREIALRLFISEDNAYKRLSRARKKLKEGQIELGEPSPEHQRARLPAVHHVLYLLFTEGYLSHHAETAIRRELCGEALRLAQILAAHEVGQAPETYALVALMHLHTARIGARQDETGLRLLEEQDRSLWDTAQIGEGLKWLARSAEGAAFSRYHAEAGIAAEHCLSPSLSETRWEKVVEFYSLLEQVSPSPLHRLNRAVATAEWKGPAEGLAVLEDEKPPAWLEGSYLWCAAAADLHRRCGDAERAAEYQERALRLAPSDSVKALLERRLTGSG